MVKPIPRAAGRRPSCLRGHRGRRARALRSRVLLELAERFEARAPVLAPIPTRDTAKPWRLRSQSGRLAAERQPMIGGELRKRPRGAASQPGNLVGDRRPVAGRQQRVALDHAVDQPAGQASVAQSLTKGVGADINITDLAPNGRGQPLGYLCPDGPQARSVCSWCPGA